MLVSIQRTKNLRGGGLRVCGGGGLRSNFGGNFFVFMCFFGT